MTDQQKRNIFFLYLNAIVWTALFTAHEVSHLAYSIAVAGPAALCMIDGFLQLWSEFRAQA